MSAVFNYQQHLEATSCVVCGIQFAVPPYFIKQCRENAGNLYCPNGHRLGWSETEADRLRKQLEKAKQEAEWQRGRAAAKEKELIAQKGLTTKAKKKLARIGNGVCPECKRTFVNIARHMQSKHGAKCNQPPKGSQVRDA